MNVFTRNNRTGNSRTRGSVLAAAVLGITAAGGSLSALATESVAVENIGAIYDTRQQVLATPGTVSDDLESVIEAQIARWLNPSDAVAQSISRDVQAEENQESVASRNINAIFAPHSAS